MGHELGWEQGLRWQSGGRATALQNGLAVKRKAADIPVNREEGTVGGENSAAARQQSQAYQGRAAEDVLRVTLGRDADDAASCASPRRVTPSTLSAARRSLAWRSCQAAAEFSPPTAPSSRLTGMSAACLCTVRPLQPTFGSRDRCLRRSAQTLECGGSATAFVVSAPSPNRIPCPTGDGTSSFH